MFIHIGEKIRKRREEKGVSEEDFALYLGVTCKEVVRWERGDSYPDFELLPVIANYFGITTDELLCMEMFSSEDKIRGYTDSFAEKVAAGKLPEAVETVREGVKHFPKEYRLRVLLMYGLYLSCDRPAANKHYSPEILAIGDDIMEHCTDDPLRLEAKRILCLHYAEDLCDTEKARQIAMSMPSRKSCREEILPLIAEGEAKLTAVQENINAYASCLMESVISLAENDPFLKNSEKIEYCELARSLRALLYPAGDIYEGAYTHMMLLRDLAVLYAAEGKKEKALDALYDCAGCAADFDALPKAASHTSPLVSRVRFSKQQLRIPGKNKKTPLRDIFIGDILSLRCFDDLRYEEKITEMLKLFRK